MMNPIESRNRFDELCAGRAMGDLSAEEERELVALGKLLGVEPDDSFEMLAASLEMDALKKDPARLPAGLEARLHALADGKSQGPLAPILRPEIPSWKRFAFHPIAGWAAAAAILVIAIVDPFRKSSVPSILSEARLRANAGDLIERRFSGLGEFKKADGRLVWSDGLQQGLMTLSGLPANDPRKFQYQLWIIDPTRDADAPVDGGVFDIPSAESPAVVPIAAKLAIRKPRAFVITVEKPGGVVKSKQEMVVAIAKG
jgi:hypothetical protein